MKVINKNYFASVLSLLPYKVADKLKRYAEAFEKDVFINELRFRLLRPSSLTVDGENIILDITFSENDMRTLMLSLCKGSPYYYEDHIKKGYLPLSDGIRCGICKSDDSYLNAESVVIRLPYDTPFQKELVDILVKDGRVKSTLVFSPPGEGKTSVLRMLIHALSSRMYGFRSSVIDTRRELYTKESSSGTLTDYVYSTNKADAMYFALSTLSPQIIFCDEIGKNDDTIALCDVLNAGCAIIASAHAYDTDGLFRRENIKKLHNTGAFETYVCVKRNIIERKFIFDIYDAGDIL